MANPRNRDVFDPVSILRRVDAHDAYMREEKDLMGLAEAMFNTSAKLLRTAVGNVRAWLSLTASQPYLHIDHHGEA